MTARLPDWPRMMKRDMAAAYCSLSVAAFEREVSACMLPMPVKLGGRDHWCRRSLDAALDRLTGSAETMSIEDELRKKYG